MLPKFVQEAPLHLPELLHVLGPRRELGRRGARPGPPEATRPRYSGLVFYYYDYVIIVIIIIIIAYIIMMVIIIVIPNIQDKLLDYCYPKQSE